MLTAFHSKQRGPPTRPGRPPSSAKTPPYVEPASCHAATVHVTNACAHTVAGGVVWICSGVAAKARTVRHAAAPVAVAIATGAGSVVRARSGAARATVPRYAFPVPACTLITA